MSASWLAQPIHDYPDEHAAGMGLLAEPVACLADRGDFAIVGSRGASHRSRMSRRARQLPGSAIAIPDRILERLE